MSDLWSELAVFAISLVALTVAYWTGRNRSAKGRLAVGALCMLVALPLTAFARYNSDAAWLQSEAAAYTYIAALMMFLVTGIGLPIWALQDYLLAKFFNERPSASGDGPSS